jgi:RNA-directed DNA polymerase
MSVLTSLKAATSLADVAHLVGYKPSALSFVLYKHGGSNYTKFEIPKRAGGSRQIAAPKSQLKLVQRRLADLLLSCVEEINKTNGYPDQIAHGFKIGRSIITNATRHRNRRFVFNIDLSDFFGTINFGRVRGFFIKEKNFALNPAVATVLAQIACFENSLPQGSPCSPVISNLVGHILDMRLVQVAKSHGCTYTRYADDLTFSTNKMPFPAELAIRDTNSPHSWLVGPALLKSIHKSGFVVNTKKTRMQYCDSRQEVTGLVVNRRLNTRAEYRHSVRAMVNRLTTTGEFSLFGPAVQNGVLTVTHIKGTNAQLRGMLGFINSVNAHSARVAKIPTQQAVPLSQTNYQRFLLFTEFYAAPTPVIICEGATDNIYLLHAIRALATQFPALAHIKSSGEIDLKVRLFKYANTGTGETLSLSGGANDLGKFILTYHRELKRFAAHGMEHPLVLFIDNDDGAKSIYSIVKQILGKKPTGAEKFIRVTGNLYVAPTPLLEGGAQSEVENFFQADLLATKIDGKSFSAKKDIDPDTEYGKVVFAHKVVRANAHSINFEGFAPILENLAAIVEAHKSNVWEA